MATTTVFRANESLVQGEVSGLAMGVASVTGPASYSQGGFAVDLATDEALPRQPFLVHCDIIGSSTFVPGETSNVLDYIAKYDYANNLLIVYDPADASEVSGSTNLSTYTFRLFWVASKH